MATPRDAQSIAELRFRAWKADPAAAYAEIIAAIDDEETELREGDQLDYKEATPLWRNTTDFPNEQKRRNKIKITLSEYTTAFANTDGGLLIYGIGTEGSNVLPARVALADDIEELHKHCTELFRDVIEPPLSGIEALKLPSPEDPKRGLVVVFTPRSAHPPHRASKLPGMPFLMRAQDNCVPIPTGMLRNMFFPKASPFCSLVCSLIVIQQGEGLRFQFDVGVRNDGAVSARDCTVLQQRVFSQVTDAQGPWVRIRNSNHYVSEATIHPMQTVPFCSIQSLNLSMEQAMSYEGEFSATIYTADSQPVRSSILIPKNSLEGFIADLRGKRQSLKLESNTQFVE